MIDTFAHSWGGGSLENVSNFENFRSGAKIVYTFAMDWGATGKFFQFSHFFVPFQFFRMFKTLVLSQLTALTAIIPCVNTITHNSAAYSVCTKDGHYILRNGAKVGAAWPCGHVWPS